MPGSKYLETIQKAMNERAQSLPSRKRSQRQDPDTVTEANSVAQPPPVTQQQYADELDIISRDAIHTAIDAIPGLRHIKVYDGKGKVLGRSYKVKLWPTLILLRNGEEVERLVRPVTVDDIRPALARLQQG